MSDTDTSTYYDQSEFIEAARVPEYQTNARYRDAVAAKLARSHDAGTIAKPDSTRYGATPTTYNSVERFSTTHTSVAEQSSPLAHTRDEVLARARSPHDPAQREASDLFSGAFSSGVAIAVAASAPQFAVDPSYRKAVADKVRRSAHSLSDSDLQVARTLGVIA